MIRTPLFRMPALALAFAAAAAFGGPVGQDEVATQPITLPGLQDAAAADPAASSAAAVAARILEEAQAGATSDDAHAPPAHRRAAHPGATASGASASAAASPAAGRNAPPAEESPLRDAAKAAMAWVKDVVPGLRSEDEDEDRPVRPSEVVDWDGQSLEGGTRGSTRSHGSNLAGAGITAAGPPAAGMPSLDSKAPGDAPRLLRDAIEMLETVIGHPMAWLVIALFVIGGYAMGKVDRRPK